MDDAAEALPDCDGPLRTAISSSARIPRSTERNISATTTFRWSAQSLVMYGAVRTSSCSIAPMTRNAAVFTVGGAA